MSLFLSWIFGRLLGFGLPVLITIGAAVVAWKFKGQPRRLALDALIVAGCWFGVTFITQAAVKQERAIWQTKYDVAVAAWARKSIEAASDNATQNAVDEAQVAALKQEIDDYEQGRKSPDWKFTPEDTTHYQRLLPH